jgi:hypothetical protein
MVPYDCPEEDPVKDAQGNLVLGRTRWWRFAAVLGPAVAAAGLLVTGIANGALPASFAVSGSSFVVTADSLDGTGVVQYGGLVSGVDTANPLTNTHPVAVSGISDATLVNLCQSVLIPHSTIGLVIRAGQPGVTPVHATNLIIGMDSLTGDAKFTNILIGQDASTLTAGGPDAHGMPGGFGQQADHVTITGLHQVAWSTSAGTFELHGLDMHVTTNGETCP